MQTPLDEVGAECKPDRHFEKLNDQFCPGHFAIVVVPLAGDVRSPRLLSRCASSFDHLVGTAVQRKRDREAEHLGGL